MGFRLYLLLLSSIYSLFAYGFSAGPATRLSILTAEGGDQIYNTFGHSAIRLVDTTQQIDIVFNYGTFDFGAPNFIGNFINGKLDYYLNDESTNNFVMNYIYQNRTLYQQNLSLDTSQINQIVAFLEWNLKKENRVYRYDFLFDNCATRIRDIFEKMDTSYEIQYIHPESHRSFRKLIHRDAGKQVPWLDWGMDLLLGLNCDRDITDREYTFLPAYIFEMFAISKNNKYRKLVDETNVLFQAVPVKPITHWLTPSVCNLFLFLVILLITYYEFTKKIKSYKWDIVWLLFLGFMGLLMCYEWFFTEHSVTHWNLNIIWANPLYLLFMIVWIRGKNKILQSKLAKFFIYSILAFTILGYCCLQPYHIASLPIIAMVLVRLIFIQRKNLL